MANPQVTILIPHYKTLQLTKLCLRLIRKYTSLSLANVVVIDNDSADESTNYLRSLKWITLIERPKVAGEPPVLSHSRALDLALEQVTTPYVLSIHTDTLVRNNQWLPFLVDECQKDSNTGGIGSWKLEKKPSWKLALKFIEGLFQRREKEGQGKNHYYLRSHCALYRMDLIKKYNLSFSDDLEVAGKAMHRKLVANGHKMVFLPSETLLNYMDHINHATTVLNPELSRKQASVNKGLKRIQKSLQSFNADEILKTDSLDN